MNTKWISSRWGLGSALEVREGAKGHDYEGPGQTWVKVDWTHLLTRERQGEPDCSDGWQSTFRYRTYRKGWMCFRIMSREQKKKKEKQLAGRDHSPPSQTQMLQMSAGMVSEQFRGRNSWEELERWRDFYLWNVIICYFIYIYIYMYIYSFFLHEWRLTFWNGSRYQILRSLTPVTGQHSKD